MAKKQTKGKEKQVEEKKIAEKPKEEKKNASTSISVAAPVQVQRQLEVVREEPEQDNDMTTMGQSLS
jgi:hypothetical protein